MQRPPAVAGRFYPGDDAALRAEVRGYLAGEPAAALAAIGPHAGFIYSGGILGETYARVHVPKTVVVLCPNHTGRGARRSCWHRGSWSVPGGAVQIDEGLADALIEETTLEPDTLAHLAEHAIEVHVPFIRERNAAATIVPIVLGHLAAAEAIALGQAIADVIAARDDVLIAASTDMSHYLSAEQARDRDALAIAQVLALDPDGLHATVERHDISMCGYVPTTVAIAAAKRRGATRATLVRYGNSGERSGDLDRVVGYAGFVIH